MRKPPRLVSSNNDKHVNMTPRRALGRPPTALPPPACRQLHANITRAKATTPTERDEEVLRKSYFSQNCLGDVSIFPVRGKTPSSVMRRVCSNCAVRLPSMVAEVQSSGQQIFFAEQKKTRKKTITHTRTHTHTRNIWGHFKCWEIQIKIIKEMQSHKTEYIDIINRHESTPFSRGGQLIDRQHTSIRYMRVGFSEN